MLFNLDQCIIGSTLNNTNQHSSEWSTLINHRLTLINPKCWQCQHFTRNKDIKWDGLMAWIPSCVPSLEMTAVSMISLPSDDGEFIPCWFPSHPPLILSMYVTVWDPYWNKSRSEIWWTPTNASFTLCVKPWTRIVLLCHWFSRPILPALMDIKWSRQLIIPTACKLKDTHWHF